MHLRIQLVPSIFERLHYIMIIKLSKEYLTSKLPDFQFDGTWIAGGAIRDSLVDAKYSDIDIFGTSKEKLDLFIETNLKGCKKVHDTDRIKTFYKGKDKIQVIYMDNADIEACLSRFDFKMCQFAYDGESIYTFGESLINLFRKKITINNIDPQFAVDSLRRLQKYIQKGFTICDGGLKSMVDIIRSATQQQIDDQFEWYRDARNARGERVARIRRFD